MELFEELERRVRYIIQRNRQLEQQLQELQLQGTQLKSTCERLEVALLQESDQVSKLLEEKQSIKLSIDELLGSIIALENAQK